MLAGMFTVAPEFISVVYGSKWIPMVVPVQILCVAGAVKSVETSSGSIIKSKGRPDIEFKWNIIRASVLAIAILIGVKYGINGVAIAFTLVTFFVFLLFQRVTNRLINLKSLNYISALYPAIIGSLSIVMGVRLYKLFIKAYNIPDTLFLISSVIFGIGVYGLFLHIFFRGLIQDMRILLIKIRA
jgi:O-antigen/teichoic acid export membrane protein